MTWAQPITISNPLPPTHCAAEASNNLATGCFDSDRTWTSQMTLATCSLSQEAAAVGDRGVSGQLPYSIPFSGLSYSLKPQGNTPRTTDDTHNLRRHGKRLCFHLRTPRLSMLIQPPPLHSNRLVCTPSKFGHKPGLW
jgi:hypothetical protein